MPIFVGCVGFISAGGGFLANEGWGMLPEERFDSEETAADYHEVSFHNAVGSHDKDIRLMFRGGWRFGWGKYSVVDDLHPYSWCYNNPGLVKASEKGS